MFSVHRDDVEGVAVTEFPYRDKMLPVTGVTIRWLSKEGKDKQGGPEYGLRHFTVAPGGDIPIHKHFYVQTMYIISGEFQCVLHDAETDAPLKTWAGGPGDSVYVASMEPHSMRNTSATEPGTFLCCICNVREDSVL